MGPGRHGQRVSPTTTEVGYGVEALPDDEGVEPRPASQGVIAGPAEDDADVAQRKGCRTPDLCAAVAGDLPAQVHGDGDARKAGVEGVLSGAAVKGEPGA